MRDCLSDVAVDAIPNEIEAFSLRVGGIFKGDRLCLLDKLCDAQPRHG